MANKTTAKSRPIQWSTWRIKWLRSLRRKSDSWWASAAGDLEEIYNVRNVRLAGCSVIDGNVSSPTQVLQLSLWERKRGDYVSFQWRPTVKPLWNKRANGRLTPVKNASLCVKRGRIRRLDKELFRGKSGTFLKKRPLYGVTPETYHGPDMPILDSNWYEEQ